MGAYNPTLVFLVGLPGGIKLELEHKLYNAFLQQPQHWYDVIRNVTHDADGVRAFYDSLRMGEVICVVDDMLCCAKFRYDIIDRATEHCKKIGKKVTIWEIVVCSEEDLARANRRASAKTQPTIAKLYKHLLEGTR